MMAIWTLGHISRLLIAAGQLSPSSVTDVEYVAAQFIAYHKHLIFWQYAKSPRILTLFSVAHVIYHVYCQILIKTAVQSDRNRLAAHRDKPSNWAKIGSCKGR